MLVIAMRRRWMLCAFALLAGCGKRPAPHLFEYERLPVQGSLADAQHAGFTDCIRGDSSVRCRREGTMVAGRGPYSAAVDLRYGDGSGGFYELTLWNNDDQTEMISFGAMLARQGWHVCRTGMSENAGDQEIYTRPGSRVRFSIDISYWGKRRLRIIPELNQPTGKCW